MIRSAVAVHLAEQLNAEPDMGDAEAYPVWPGDKWLTRQLIFGVSTSGTIEYPFAMAGDKTSRDTYSTEWRVHVAGMRTVAEAAERRDDLVSLLVRMVGPDLTLNGFAANGEEVSDVPSFSVSTRQGDSDKGPLATADVTINIETQTV